MNKYIILLSLISYFFINCKSQVEKTSDTPKIIEIPLFPAHDSYFNGHKDIVRTIGPTTITRNVLQDRNGMFWFATWEGLIVYDGKEFTNLTNKYELSRYRFFALLEDQKGNLWAGTVGAGLFKYDGKEFTQYTTEDGLGSNTIGCLFQNKDGDIWAGTLNGISKFNGTTFTTFRTKTEGDDNDVNSIIEDKDGKLWVGARGKLVTFDGSTFTEVKNNDQSNFYNVRTICKRKNGDIWIGGNNGVNSYDGAKWTNKSEDFGGYIYEDSKKNVWIAKSGKKYQHGMVLMKYETSPAPIRTMTESKIYEPDGQVFGIIEDKQNNIWFGLENGIAKYDGKEFEFFK